jgi:hypothetical protein
MTTAIRTFFDPAGDHLFLENTNPASDGMTSKYVNFLLYTLQ